MKNLTLPIAALVLAAGIAVPSLPAAAAVPPDVAAYAQKFDQFPATKGQGSESERLQKLFDLFWDLQMHASPEFATYVGYPGLNDRWSDSSPESIAFGRQLSHKILVAIDSIDRAQLKAAEQVNYDLAHHHVDEGIEGEKFHGEYLQISQLGGVQQGIPQLLSVMPAGNVKDYENIIARLRGIPTVIDQSMALLDQGLAEGITPPKVTLRDVPAQVQSVLVDDPMKSPMLKAFQKFPDSISTAEQERLKREATAAFTDQVAPAYRKLHGYLVNTYLPAARESIATGDLPNGKAWYAFQARSYTTTNLTPEQIHQIGLAEVKRIRKEMDAQMAATGFKGSFEEFCNFLRTDPRFFYDKPEDLLAGYRDIAKRIDPELVKLFGKLPRLPYGVIPVPAYSEKSQTTAYYEEGSLAAGRPGEFNANTYDLKSRPKWEMEALTSHEAVPGHHLQLALAQELAVAQVRRLHRLRRGVGALRREPGGRDRPLQGPLLPLRPAHLRDLAGDPPGGRHRHPHHGMEPAESDRLLQGQLRQGRSRHRGRDRPLHRLAGAGARLQARRAEDQGDARLRAEGAGREVRPPRLPRPRAGQRRRAARPARAEHQGVGGGGEGGDAGGTGEGGCPVASGATGGGGGGTSVHPLR